MRLLRRLVLIGVNSIWLRYSSPLHYEPIQPALLRTE